MSYLDGVVASNTAAAPFGLTPAHAVPIHQQWEPLFLVNGLTLW